MGRYYTEKDVERWEKVDKDIGRLHLDKLAANPPQQQVDFRLSMLSNECQARGMTCIARGRFSEAMVCFRESVEWLCKMYDRWEKGVGRAMEAGHYQSLLLAHVVNDAELINGFARHYRADAGTDDSMYLGPILKCITLKDLDGARSALAQKKPRKFERQFTGYPDCFEAIIDKDQTRFVEAIAEAAKNWAKWASRVVKGLPGSFCFIQGVGIVRLAEKTLGTRIPVVQEFLPPELLK